MLLKAANGLLCISLLYKGYIVLVVGKLGGLMCLCGPTGPHCCGLCATQMLTCCHLLGMKAADVSLM
jgi:hypothetical protein